MLNAIFHSKALFDINQISQSNPKLARKVFELVTDICAHPFEGLGKPEELKYNLSGHWSRRISDEHRLVYRIENDTAIIVSCKGHYQ